MTDLIPAAPSGKQLIQSYGGGGFRVSGVRYRGSLLVFPETTLPWAVAGDIVPASLVPVMEAVPAVELLLIGTGTAIVPVSADLRGELRARGIAVEVMDTGAACRTYNVLMVESRRVAAAVVATP